MSQPAKPSLGRKILKITGIILGVIVGLLLIASIFLLTVLEPVVGRILKEQVTENTDGLYTLEYDDLQLSLLTGTLTLEEMLVYPDTVLHRQQREAGTAADMLLRVEAPRFRIASINLINLLFRNRADIGSVSAENPVVTLIADEKAQQKAAAAQHRDGGDALSGALERLHIGKIDIQDARLRYLTLEEQKLPRHEIPQVSLLLQGLHVNLQHQQEASHMFQADDVQFQVRDYAYRSVDSVYMLQVGLLSYSSEQATLRAEGIALLPDHETNTALGPAEARHTLYNIHVPGLRITGLDAIEAYRTKQLQLNEVLLEKPALGILLQTNVSTNPEPLDLPEFYNHISDYLHTIDIGALHLEEGNIKVREKIEQLYTVHELNRANFTLQEIHIDSSTMYFPKENFLAETMLLSAESYAYQHPLDPHAVRTGTVELSTQNNYLHVNAVQVIGDKEKNDRLKRTGQAQPIVYTVHAPGLHFRNMDLIKALETSRLTIGTIDILNPAIEIRRDKSVEKADTDAGLENAYASVSDFVKSLAVENIHVQDASLRHLAGTRNLRRIQELEHVSLNATGLVIDSAFVYSPASEGFPVEEAVLTAHDYTFRTPDNIYTFTLERIHYSTRTQVLSARSLALTSDKEANTRLSALGDANRNLFDITTNRFSVTGLDIIKAVETGELLMDEVLLGQPEVTMLKDRTIPPPPQEQQGQGTLDDLYSIVNPIKVNTLRLEDGTFTYREKREAVIRTQLLEHASATVLGLNLGSARLDALDEILPMQEMMLTARDYTYRSPDGIYEVKLDSLHYSSRQQELTARRLDVVSDKEENARLKRENLEQANRNLFDVSAERFRVTGLDLIQAYETGRFSMKEMLLTAPELAILQDRNVPSSSEEGEAETESTNDTETLEQIAEVVEIFRVEQLRINDGNVQFNILQDTVLTSQEIAHVSVAIDQLRTASLETNDPLEMFQADDIGIVVRDYVYALPDSLYTLEVGEIRSSLREQSLHIENLHLNPLYGRDEFVSRLTYEDDRFDIHVPHILMRGIDLDALFNKQEFIMEKALLQNPVFDIYRDKRIPEDPDRRPPTLQEALRQVEYYVAIDTLAVEKGLLTYSEVAPNGIEPGVLQFVNTDLEALNVTNVPALIEQDSIATMSASTQLMGESRLSVRFRFHLNHPENLYTYEGTLSPMDFTALNPLFRNLIFVSIEDGHINKATFYVEATEHVAEGRMRFFYNDFEILLIDKEDPENPGFLRVAGSWLLNKLVLKSDNPAGRRDLRLGTVEAERDYTKSVFNHMAKAMIDGITSSLTTPFVEKLLDRFVEL